MKAVKINFFKLVAFCLFAMATVRPAAAEGWPANYQGVMLQGFYWDSNNETSWKNLTAQADELSKYFSLIWVPNSAKSNGMPAMGYMPIYWFTNHNSSFGNENELRYMIKTFKEKGTGIIEDVVINHRVGVSNWYNFPTETWNGKTYQLTNGAICSTDEMWRGGGYNCPYTRGNADTGDDFDGARDLDHTNATVQAHIKDYCKFLLEDLGYAGFRYDMVKGYGGQYTKIYNQYAKPRFSVGEYFDGSYDAVAAWIESTGKESAAFDFPFKYAVNEAFGSSDMSRLVWKANGVTDQPAGLIHFGYPRYAVTFVDNHDTARDGSKFNGNVVAANAFMLCSPGTPCVFWPHYTANKAAIQKLIDARNSVGLHNMSAVNVLRADRNCYMAEVTGTKGRLVVKIGSAMASPQGYSDSQIVASGTDYCVWTTTAGGNDTPTTETFNIYFDNTSSNWSTPYIHYWGASESTWPGVPMVRHKDNVWVYAVPAGTTGCLFNAGNGDATKTPDFVASANHIYTTAGDRGVYDGQGGNSDDKPGSYPETLYLIGNLNGMTWDTTRPVAASGNNGYYLWNGIQFDNSGDGSAYFSFITRTGANWDVVNQGDRYGSEAFNNGMENFALSIGAEGNIVLNAAGVSSMGATAWQITPGKYNVEANLSTMRVRVTDPAGADDAIVDGDAPVEYFNFFGLPVQTPTHGFYIRRQGAVVTKVYIP